MAAAGCGDGEESVDAAGKSSGDSAGGFVPRPHEDSGGGSKQFRVEGGDNSIQSFGAETGGKEFKRAAVAFHNFFDARAEGQWAAACSYLSSGIVTSLRNYASEAKGADGPNCASAVELATDPAAMRALRVEAKRVDVASLRVEGNRAYLLYRDAYDDPFAIAMVREKGAWKVGAQGGYPLGGLR